ERVWTEQALHHRCKRTQCPLGHWHTHAVLAPPHDLARQMTLQHQLEEVFLDGPVELELRRQPERRFRERAIEQRDAQVERLAVGHSLCPPKGVLRTLQRG